QFAHWYVRHELGITNPPKPGSRQARSTPCWVKTQPTDLGRNQLQLLNNTLIAGKKQRTQPTQNKVNSSLDSAAASLAAIRQVLALLEVPSYRSSFFQGSVGPEFLVLFP